MGVAAEPAITCAKILSPGSDLQAALMSTAPGSTLCLGGGDWPDPKLSALYPSAMVTIAGKPGQTVDMAGLTLGYGAIGNLTFEGIHFTAGVRATDTVAGNLVFQYNDLHDIADFAFYFYPGGNGNSGTARQTGVTIRNNQIDHVGQCLEADQAESGPLTDFTFTHNVCGPGIGYGQRSGGNGGHYIQVGHVSGFTFDNNAFLGQPDPVTRTDGDHLNVIHIPNSSNNVSISNNVFWHTETLGQMVMLQSGTQDDITIENNLDVEDAQTSDIPFAVYGVHGLRFTHNTIVNDPGYPGTFLGPRCTDSAELLRALDRG